MKHCNVCGNTKQDDDFHKRAASIDGLAARCKSCQSEYDIARANLPNRIMARREYARTEAGKSASSKAKKVWQSRNTLKRKAHVIIGNAIRDGRLEKQPCEICGDAQVHAHHDDYAKPLDVRWLCITHHNEWHRINGEAANG
jgi:ribosomal protein S27AE